MFNESGARIEELLKFAQIAGLKPVDERAIVGDPVAACGLNRREGEPQPSD